MGAVTKLETPATAQQNPPKRKLLQQLADRYGVEPEIFKRTVSAVSMPNPHTDEELISCLIVANEHDLNPLTKEIHFMRTKTGQIMPIVGVDGWIKKLNAHPHFNGFVFDHQWSQDGKQLVAVTCKIFRKDRDHPVMATELMSECARLPAQGKGPNAWSMTPSRMLRHRALMQAARYAVGFGGAMDMDEFERWQAEMKDITPKTAVLPVPTDIEDGTGNQETVTATVTEAEATQVKPEAEEPSAILMAYETALKGCTTEAAVKKTDKAHKTYLDTLDADLGKAAEEIRTRELKRIKGADKPSEQGGVVIAKIAGG